jgi:hypothetical protein
MGVYMKKIIIVVVVLISLLLMLVPSNTVISARPTFYLNFDDPKYSAGDQISEDDIYSETDNPTVFQVSDSQYFSSPNSFYMGLTTDGYDGYWYLNYPD